MWSSSKVFTLVELTKLFFHSCFEVMVASNSWKMCFNFPVFSCPIRIDTSARLSTWCHVYLVFVSLNSRERTAFCNFTQNKHWPFSWPPFKWALSHGCSQFELCRLKPLLMTRIFKVTGGVKGQIALYIISASSYPIKLKFGMIVEYLKKEKKKSGRGGDHILWLFVSLSYI